MNHKKPRRLYNEEKFAVKRRCIRKRAPGTRAPQEMPAQPNDRWSLDFLSDVLEPGRRSRITAAIDHCMRECLALIADTSLSGRRVARKLHGRSWFPLRFLPNVLRHRVDQPRHSRMAERDRRSLTLHRVWPTDAERVQRELERPPPRQAHQRRCLHELRGRSTEARQVALRLQHHQGKLGAGRTHARTQFFKSSTLGARADPSTMHNQDSPCECGNLGLRSPLRRPPPPWPHRIPTSGAGNNRGAKPAARLRSADHPAWRRNLQCTNIQTGPVSGGPVRWFSMT